MFHPYQFVGIKWLSSLFVKMVPLVFPNKQKRSESYDVNTFYVPFPGS